MVLAAVLGAAGPLIGLANGGYDIDAVGPAAVGVLIVVAGAVAIVPGAFPRSGSGLLAVGGLAGLALLTVVSLAWSPNPDLGWLIAAKTILYLGAFLLAVLVVRSSGAAMAALAGLAAGATVLALVTVLRVTTADDPLPQFFANRLSGSVGYHNGFATTLLARLGGAPGGRLRARGDAGRGRAPRPLRRGPGRRHGDRPRGAVARGDPRRPGRGGRPAGDLAGPRPHGAAAGRGDRWRGSRPTASSPT